MSYARVATDDPDEPAPGQGGGYPPPSPPSPLSSTLPSSTTSARWRVLRFAPRPILALLACVVVVHYLTLLVSVHVDPAPSQDWIRPASLPLPLSAPLPSSPESESAGTPLRDATPVASALRFLALAEAEVAALGLDTCGDELGRAMVDAAAQRRVVYCAGSSGGGRIEEEGDREGGDEGVTPGDEDYRAHLEAASRRDARVECMPFRPLGSLDARDDSTDPSPSSASNSSNSSDPDPDAIVPEWWPGATPPCISQYLRPTQRINQRHFVAPRCTLTRAGEALRHPPPDAFVGTSIVDEEARCKRVLGHTVVFVQRQDQWNP